MTTTTYICAAEDCVNTFEQSGPKSRQRRKTCSRECSLKLQISANQTLDRGTGTCALLGCNETWAITHDNRKQKYHSKACANSSRTTIQPDVITSSVLKVTSPAIALGHVSQQEIFGDFTYKVYAHETHDARKMLAIQGQLQNLRGENLVKIGARDCEVVKVPPSEKGVFLNANHVQGNDSSSVKLGLTRDRELVAVMTFAKPRFSKQYQWELSRFATRSGLNIIGGASRLFVSFVRQYAPGSIVSYSDNAKTRGGMYATMGFVLDHEAKSNYVWVKGTEVRSRYQCQLHKLKEEFPDMLKGLTERQIMSSLGWEQRFDAGNKVWIWKADN